MQYPDNRDFELQVSKSQSFDSIIFSEAGSSHYFYPENLLPGTEYFWRARAKLPSTQYSAWSDAFSFQTGNFISLKHNQCTSATFSPDGKWLVTAGADSMLKIWDVNKGTLLSSITDDPFSEVIFSPNRKILATRKTYSCTTIKLWDFNTGALLHTLDGHPEHIRSIDFSPDGEMLVSTGNNVKYYLWDVDSGDLLESHDLSYYDAWGLTVRFSPDGKTIVLSKLYGLIDLIDLQTRNTIQTFSGHSNDANGVAFSPDAAKIITGAATYFDYSVRLWDVATGNIVYILDQTSSGSDKWLNSVVAFSPDGNRAVSVGGIETSFSVRTSHVYIWDVASGTLVNTMNSQPIGLNFSPDGSLLAVTTKLGVELRMFGPSTIPIAPFLLKPGIGSITSDNEFVWSPSGGGTYHLQISSVPDFSSPIFENTNLPTSRANVTGLVAGQYVWRVQAQNNAGSSEWSRVGLFTYTLSPTVTTGSASSVTSTSATLNATVNPNGASTTAVFEYGTSTNYGTTVAAMQSPLTGSAAQAASVILSGLTSGTTYHFRAKGTNSVGTNYGNDQSFTTSSVIYVNKDGICGGNSPCYTSIQAAMDAASTGTAIKIAQGTYDESFVLNESKSLTLQGGWDSSFTSQTSNTTFIKAPKASQGSLTLQMVTIKP